ncbi:hypothetical protein FJZ41_00340 [Candidatus Shapirobacteria bacterium]|nr:hypothetical protein [Candidatus Shapirobacteria bacterium]
MKELSLRRRIVAIVSIGFCVVLFSALIYFPIQNIQDTKVMIALPPVYSDESKTNGWSFKINGEEIPAGEELILFRTLEISVFRIPSGELVDTLDIHSLAEKDDYISWVYDSFYSYNPDSGEQEKIERLYLTINHERNISINIDNQ